MTKNTEAMTQNTEEWRQVRVGKVTASRIGAILGVDKKMSRDEIMRQMVREHHGAEDEISDFLRTILDHGKESEAEALSAVQDMLGEFIDDCGFVQHPKIEWMGCSPDGLLGDDRGVEIKCPTKRRKNLDDVLYDEAYKCQCLFSLIVTGREVWTLYVYRDGDITEREFDRKYAEIWFSENVSKLDEFYREYLDIVASEELSSPYLEPLEIERTDLLWATATDKYFRALDGLAEYKAKMSAAKDYLIFLSEGKKSRGNGLLVYPQKGRKKTNYSKAVKDAGIDVSEYEEYSDPTWHIKVSR